MASSPASFRHLPTNARQLSAPLPVIAASFVSPSRNSRVRGSFGASAPEALASVLSVCVSVCVCGGVSETFRSCFLKRFTRSVETSDLNCLRAQLCGANPVSSWSIRPAFTSAARYSDALDCLTRKLNAMISICGSRPSFFDATQRNAIQIQRIASGKSRIFGSLITSSSRRNQRLMWRPFGNCRDHTTAADCECNHIRRLPLK